MAFVDECKILFKAGNGGNGIVAWRREANVPLGGPAGGNGGNGGSIILIGDHNENSLYTLKLWKHAFAHDGENGQVKTMHGKNGDDVFVKVPVGTMVHDAKTNELIVDITENEQQFVLCDGGLGGHGNFHFKSGMNKAPTLYELGDLGEAIECKLVLKHIADVGIVGLPNAGKSTLISQISAAKPKTANYQFTTLIPVLGVVHIDNHKIIFADIPGLIEGASEGLGLGHDFLKHIERTTILVHLISMDDADSVDPYKSFETIMHELKNYAPILIEKPMIIVANKMDAPGAEEKLIKLKKKLKKYKIIEASTGLAINVDLIVKEAYKELMYMKENKKKEVAEPTVIKYEKKLKPDELLDRTLHITKIADNTWNVECEFLKYWARKLPLNTPDNIVRFNQKMRTLDVEKTLGQMGAEPRDTINIYQVQMQYEQ